MIKMAYNKFFRLILQFLEKELWNFCGKMTQVAKSKSYLAQHKEQSLATFHGIERFLLQIDV